MKKCNRSWPFLLLIFFNLLCAAAVILLCVRVNIETEDIKKQTAQAEKDYASLEIKLTELDKKPKEKQMKVAEEAEETDLKEENDKKGGQKEEQKNTPVQEEDENDRQQEPYGDANGRKVAIDPGHQGSWVDMSAQEPNGPGSSEMKARCSTGTQGKLQEQMKRVKGLRNCPKCGAEVADEAIFCPGCGFSLPPKVTPIPQSALQQKRCENCGSMVDEDAAFCTECGWSFTNQPQVDTSYMTEDDDEATVLLNDCQDTAANESVSEQILPDEVENIRVCKNCGAPLRPQSMFCTNCGTRADVM